MTHEYTDVPTLIGDANQRGTAAGLRFLFRYPLLCGQAPLCTLHSRLCAVYHLRGQ